MYWLSVCVCGSVLNTGSLTLFDIFGNRRWIETKMFHYNGYMFIHYYDYCYYYCRFDWWKKVIRWWKTKKTKKKKKKRQQLNGNVCVQYNVIHFIQSTDFPFNVNFNANWREIGAVHLRWECHDTHTWHRIVERNALEMVERTKEYRSRLRWCRMQAKNTVGFW